MWPEIGEQLQTGDNIKGRKNLSLRNFYSSTSSGSKPKMVIYVGEASVGYQ